MPKHKSTALNLICYPTHMLSICASSHRSQGNKRPASNKHNGEMSLKAARRIKKAIYWLDAITPWHEEKNPDTGSTFRMKLNFITLSLCAPQMHSDIDIKKYMLHPWITNISKRFALRAYIWKSEPQDNENIHFHFVTNKFLHMHVIRRAWNATQKRMGYIAVYRANQKAFHKHGFTPRPELFKQWPLEKQEKAYHHGIQTNWSDPNSTDVHSLSKVKNSAAYIAKYMTKQFTGRCPQCQKKSYFVEKPDPAPACKSCSIPLIITTPRPIEGRLWYISTALSKIRPLSMPYTGAIDAELYANNNFQDSGIELNPYCSLYLIRPSEVTKFGSHVIKDAYQHHCVQLFKHIS